MTEKAQIDPIDAELGHMIAQQRLDDVTKVNFEAHRNGELHDGWRTMDNDALATAADHAARVLKKAEKAQARAERGSWLGRLTHH